jgi:hypothetical protein
MNQNARCIGIVASIAILLFTMAFIMLISIFPAGEYSSAEQFIYAYKSTILWPVIPSFLLVLANIPFFISLFYYAEESGKPFAMVGLLFGAAYAVCSGTNYFAQLTLVPQYVHLRQSLSVALFSMQIKGSFAYAIDNLGYTFLSISFLFFSGIFSLKGFQGYIKSAFVVYGIAGILGTLGYITCNSFLESFVFISAFPYMIAVVLVLIQYFRTSARLELNERME